MKVRAFGKIKSVEKAVDHRPHLLEPTTDIRETFFEIFDGNPSDLAFLPVGIDDANREITGETVKLLTSVQNLNILVSGFMGDGGFRAFLAGDNGRGGALRLGRRQLFLAAHAPLE